MKIRNLWLLALLAAFSISLTSCFQEATAKSDISNVTPIVKNTESDNLQWNTVSDISKLQKIEKKKVIVDIYTDWCKWCKVMDEKTFTDPALRKYLDEGYHMVKLNAEDKSQIEFNGKKYDYIQSGKKGYNALALDLLEGRLAYPSFVVLDEELNRLQVIRGFKDAAQLTDMLKSI